MNKSDSLLPRAKSQGAVIAEEPAAAAVDAQANLAPEILPSMFRQALEQSFNAVLLTDAQQGAHGPRILYANPAFCRMSGYSSEELIGQTPRLLQGPLTSPDILRELRECLQAGRHFKGSTVNYRKDGTPYIVEWNISPMRDERGEITHFVSVQQDVSELVAARHTNQLLANALNAAQDAIFITDVDGKIEFANQGFELVTGYSTGEALGSLPNILKSGEQNDAFYQRLWRSLKAGQTFRATVVNRHKNGQLIHCEETITPVYDGKGVMTHFVSIIKDLSKRILAEKELRKQATVDGLTGLLNRRSGELQLEKAYRAACEGGTSICVLLADVDHFKAINDTWGHPAGDVVLKDVAHLLRSSVRTTDSVARWGGEEFLIVLPYCDLPAAQKQAERIRIRVAQKHQPQVGQITLSIGVAQLQNHDETLAGLIDRADKALYRAKKEGRNLVCCA
ncbi:sensor domain-containing diguanylate cyclase [Pseudomonas linyingensis]|nr:sensor domain-containing diguanylate cyclase [Pseudomonas linyingensis]